jgi:hypothetical protein
MNRINVLKVDIRLLGHIISPESARRQTMRDISVGFHWSFYRLLERFLRYGPVCDLGAPEVQSDDTIFSSISFPETYPKATFEDRDITVQTLLIDVTSAATEFQFPPDDPDNIWNLRWFHQHKGEIYYGLDGYATRPEWVAGKLARELSQILQMTNQEAQHGKIIYERVRRIHILVNGGVRWEFDLSKKLREMHFENPGETFGNLETRDRIGLLRGWKDDTIQRWQSLGFSD